MNTIKIFFNPTSGKSQFHSDVNNLCIYLLDRGYVVEKFVSRKEYDIYNEVMKSSHEEWEAFIVAGGDGTVNEVISAMAVSDCLTPLGIYPSGTSNDFANYIGSTKDYEQLVQLIERNTYSPVDIGKANNRYFINVLAGGTFTKVAHMTPKHRKLLLGSMAYFLEGVKEFLSDGIESRKLLIETKEKEYIENVSLILIANSSSIGGLENLAPHAEIRDGLFDCIVIKTKNILAITELVYDIFAGKHINNKNVLYFKTDELTISALDQNKYEIDIDGEYGGELPVKINVLKHKINFFMD